MLAAGLGSARLATPDHWPIVLGIAVAAVVAAFIGLWLFISIAAGLASDLVD